MRIERLAEGFLAAWSQRGTDPFAAVCAEDVHYEDPLCGEPLTGPAELAAHAERLRSAFPDARVEATGPRMMADTHVTAPAKLVGTHRGDLEGLPATGRFVVVQAVVVARAHPEQDLLWRIRTFFDSYDAAVQLGLLPVRGSLGEKALLALRGFGVRAR